MRPRGGRRPALEIGHAGWGCIQYRIQAAALAFGRICLWLGVLGAKRLTQAPTPGAVYRVASELALEVAQEAAIRPVSKAVPGGSWFLVSRGTQSGVRGGAGTGAWDEVGRRVEEEAPAVALRYAPQ